MIEQFFLIQKLTVITTQSQSGPGSNGNERVFHIVQNPGTGTSQM